MIEAAGALFRGSEHIPRENRTMTSDMPRSEATTEEAVAAPATGRAGPTATQIEAIRARIHETLGKVAITMMSLARYRHLPLVDLQSLVLEPLMRDRLVLASARAGKGEAGPDTVVGIALWASVSPEVDARIREQIRAGVFPVRLQPNEWNSGNINWLLDVIAPNRKLAMAVVANLRQVVKEGDMRLHPLVTRLVDPEVLKKMGAKPATDADGDLPDTASDHETADEDPASLQ